MRLHRFYIAPEELELDHTVWCNSKELRNQWLKVLRYREGDQVVLFDGIKNERLYKIAQVSDDAIKLELVTDMKQKLPARHVYLFWSLLKKDKNEWVIQKCTELGVSNFVPIIADRSEKTGFNLDRAEKIAIEAAEQCGRSDIPHIREPLELKTAIEEYEGKVPLLVCDEAGSEKTWTNLDRCGLLIGPEGGWSDKERQLFEEHHLAPFIIHNLTLRAETAAVAAAAKLQ